MLAAMAVLAAISLSGAPPLELSLHRDLSLDLVAGESRTLWPDGGCRDAYCVLEAHQNGVDIVLISPGGEDGRRFDLPNGRHGLERAPWPTFSRDPQPLEIQASAGEGQVRLSLKRIDSNSRRAAVGKTCEGADANAAGDRRRAALAFDAATALWDELDEPVEAARTALYLAFQYRRASGGATQDWARDPLTAFHVARERWRPLAQHPRPFSKTLNEIGHLLHQRGENREALPYLEQAIAVAEAAGDRQAAARARNNLGLTLHELGRVADARDAYLGARAAFEPAGELRRAAVAESNLAAAYQDLGQPELALDMHDKAAARFTALDDAAGLSRVASNRAVLLRRLGRFQEALDAYRGALELQTRFGIKPAQATTLNNMGELYLLLGDEAGGRRHLEEALALYRELSSGPAAKRSRGEAVTLHNLGLAARLRGGAVAAAGLFRRATEIYDERGEARSALRSQISLGIALDQQGRRDEAQNLLKMATEEALGLEDGEAAARAFLGLGELELTRSRPSSAAIALEQAETWSRRADSPALLATALLGRARAADARGQNEEARRFAHLAIDRVEQLRAGVDDVGLRMSFLATRRRAFEIAVEIELVGQDGEEAIERAFEITERAKARALLDALGPRSSKLGSGQISPPPILDVRRAAARLEAGTLALSYLLGEQKSHLFVLDDAAELEYFPLPPRAELESLIAELRRAWAKLEPGAEAADRALAESLSRLLIGPLGHRLHGVERLVVLGDGQLHGLPFAALPAPGSGSLVDRFDIVHLPSFSVLAAKQNDGAKILEAAMADEKSAIVMADPLPAPGFERIPRLPFTMLEAEALARWLAPSSVHVFTGEKAEAKALFASRSSRASLVHIATHAFVDPSAPSKTGLLLSDGLTRLGEIRGLSLSAELVVLSGCSTGLGKPVLGEGFVGLVHGFFEAGAERVIASLWPVDDRSTAQLFDHFYRHHLGAGSPASQALRRAQLDLRADARFSDPFYWAPFMLIGDWHH